MTRIRFEVSGSTDSTEAFLRRMSSNDLYAGIDRIAQRGVQALQAATPKDSGATAAGWAYEIRQNGRGIEIHWTNSHVVDGFSVVIGLQYGHGTSGGGYVQGRDFINPALRAIFDDIANSVWREVQRS